MNLLKLYELSKKNATLRVSRDMERSICPRPENNLPLGLLTVKANALPEPARWQTRCAVS